MRFVFDANVLISAALLRDSIPGLAYNKAIQKGELLISKNTLNELKTTLNRPKLRKYLKIEDKYSFLTKLENKATTIKITQTVNICCDPKDNMYLELALSGKADLIITGDNDLLVLHPFCNIPIITPKLFIDNF